MALTASTVSRQLRAAGFGIVATRNREGIRVSRAALRGYACVDVDIDRPGERGRVIEVLEPWLKEHYLVTGFDGFYTVTEKEAP